VRLTFIDLPAFTARWRYLFAVYGKWDQVNLTKAEEKHCRDVLSALKKYHRQLAGESDQP